MKKLISICLILFCLVSVASGGPGYTVVGGSVPVSGGTAYFGYNTVGGSSTQAATGQVICSAVDAPANGNGTITAIEIYSNSTNANNDVKVGLYTTNGGVPETQVGSESTYENIGTYTVTWKSFAHSQAVTNGTSYALCLEVSDSAGFNVYYNSVAGTNRWYDTNTYGDAWPDTFTSASSSGAKYSIRAVYDY